MELLLNLVWLLLALPAYWLWRTRRAPARCRFHSSQCLLALGCGLVMLFPVVSATDDLHAMRSEMEESPASKRSIRQASLDKASAWNSRLQTPPADLGALPAFSLSTERTGLTAGPSFCFPAAPPVLPADRAPPVSRLA